MNKKDITISIIGAGPGGYEAAIFASKLGAKVNLFEENEIGGVCLNKGCIPTKVFLNTAKKIKETEENYKFNIQTNSPSFDYSKILERKEKNIKHLKDGIYNLINENKVNLIKGRAKLVDNNTVFVENKNNYYKSDFVILATGSSPIIPKSFNYNGKTIITTDDLFSISELPESIIIIGGGFASVEIGQYLTRFGVKVTIIEEQKHILPDEDSDIIRKFNRILKKDNIKVITKTRVDEVIDHKNSVEVKTNNGIILTAQMVLICIGRTPNSSNLFSETLPIITNSKGYIQVNEYLETNLENVYAIGDLIDTPMLAHMASHESIIAVNNIFGNNIIIDYNAVPSTIYTEPEIASVGFKEDLLKKNKIKYKKGTFPFRLLGRSLTLNKQDGLVKILTTPDNTIIGASIFGSNASDLIMELVLAVKLGLNTETLSETIHPHPSLSEAILEACRDVSELSINKL